MATVGQVLAARLVGAASRTVVLAATVMRARADTARAVGTAARAVDMARAVGTKAVTGTAPAMYTLMHTAQAPFISRFVGMSPASWRLSFSRLSRSGSSWAGRSAARTSLLR
jgi:hypothetical protein